MAVCLASLNISIKSNERAFFLEPKLMTIEKIKTR